MFDLFRRLSKAVRNLRTIATDCLSFFAHIGRRRLALGAENLFLRKQLALFRERQKKALPTTPADKFVFSKLARWFDWRSALVIVKPATLTGWHGAAFRRFLALEVETGREAAGNYRSEELDSASSG